MKKVPPVQCWAAKVTLRPSKKFRQVRTLVVYATCRGDAIERMLSGSVRVKQGLVETAMRVQDVVAPKEIERLLKPIDKPNGKVLVDVVPARESRK